METFYQKQSVSVKIFHKVLLKQMCFSQYFYMCMEKFYSKQSVFGRKKTAGTVFDQKFFSHIFMKFYWNKCVSFNILICTCKNSTESRCFGRKNPSKNCVWSKVFLSHFHKGLPKQMCFSQYFYMCTWINSTETLCFGRKKTARSVLDQKCFCHIIHKVLPKLMFFGQYFNMCMETFYQNKVFLFKFFIKFYWNKCVSVNILICTCKISTETKCFNRKKGQELCLIKSVSLTFS